MTFFQNGTINSCTEENVVISYLFFIPQHIAEDSAGEVYRKKAKRGMVLPYIPFGSQNPGQLDLPFCLHGRYETQKAILTDIVHSMMQQGIDKLFIVNGHGGNCFKNMIRDLALDHPEFLIVAIDWFKVVPQEGYFENKDDHAGELETSVMMHYRPDLVDLSLAGDGNYKPFKSKGLRDGIGWTPRNWMKVSEDTGIGNPHKSSAIKGEHYAKEVVIQISDLIIEVVTEDIYE